MRKQEVVPMATQDSPNLYERLGGIYSIATVVDDLIDRVMADPRLNANPLVDDAHHKVPPAGFKYLVTEMLCWARLTWIKSLPPGVRCWCAARLAAAIEQVAMALAEPEPIVPVR